MQHRRPLFISAVFGLLYSCGSPQNSAQDASGEVAQDGGIEDAPVLLGDTSEVDEPDVEVPQLDVVQVVDAALDASPVDTRLDALVSDVVLDSVIPDTSVPDARTLDVGVDSGPLPGGNCADLGLTAVTQSPLCWVHPKPFGTYVRGISAHLGRWWVSTEHGLFESTDRVRWINRSPEVGVFNTVTTDGTLLLVSSPNGVFTSTTGVNWNRTSSQAFDRVEKRGSVWVGISYLTGISSSSDGVMWTQRVPETSFFPIAIAYANGLWVVAGSDSDVRQAAFRTSPDGITWTRRSVNSTIRASFSALATDGSRFVATASDSRNSLYWLYTSTDGMTWTSGMPISTSAVSDLGWYGGSFYAATAQNGVFTSPDARSWTRVSGAPNLANLSRSNLGWLGVQTPAQEGVFSADGSMWTPWRRFIAGPSSAVVTTLGYGGNRFVALVDRMPVTSTDGLTWTAGAMVATNFFSPQFGNGRWVAAASTGIVTSTDGMSWTAVPSSPRSLDGIAFSDGVFVATTGLNQVYRSTDGMTWTAVTMPGLTGVVTSNGFLMAGNGLFVRVKSSLATSADGLRWTERVPFGASLRSVAFGAGRFVAIPACASSAPQPPALSSADGVTWTPITTTPALCGDTIAYGRGGFAVLLTGTASPFRDSTLRMSADGSTWSRPIALGNPYVASMVASADRWVFGSAFGELLATPGSL